MSRKKKRNKRVLKSPRDNRPPMHMQKRRPPETRNAPKTSKTTIIIMVIALLGFVIGAGIGISMALDDSSSLNNTTKAVAFENVTVEMTSNLNNTTVEYDGVLDNVDYNSQQDIKQYNITFNNNISY